ncbi:relaxin receptor 2-like [Melanaphis sacchari]|uniref:relaxin receptor 2-like n=1 Tax=Melanaphis sacchari TaxID=742174 RepID=UPI000DC13855|nr:relaxin receptor 2-like [Melanaphis sacchari]
MQHYHKVIDIKNPNPEPVPQLKSKRNESNTLCALSNYPSKCDCFNETWLRCNDIGLTKVPRNISSNLKKISMRSNNIVLSNDSFDEYYSLIMIHLQYNRLSVIPPFVFKHQNKLKYLFLLHNELRVLEKNALYGLENIRTLFLDNNNLVFLNLNSWKHMQNVKWIYLSHNFLTFKNECFPHLMSLIMLHLEWNRIEIINEFLFANMPNLTVLNLSNNVITVIHKNAFKNLLSLSDLNIADNRITTITQEIFHPLKILDKLVLGNNPITRINNVVFTEMKSLSSLDMNGINKENIELSLLKNLTALEFLYLKEFHYCVLYARHVDICFPNVDGLSSSFNLLPNSTFRWFLWTITVLTLIFNLLVLYGRMFNIFKDENKAINFVIRNLTVADLFMVIYLMFIGYHDQIYRNEYHLYAHKWESSNLCTMVGIMAVISSEVSMLILVFLSLDRFLLIAVPFSGYQVLKMKTAVYCMISIWVVGISISIAPLILWKQSSKFYGSNGLCYPLYIEDPFVNGWQYSAFMFLGLNTTSVLLMSVLYALMFINVRKTRHAAHVSAGDFDFAVRCFFIVLANILCWSPIIILKLAALRKYHISSKMYVWLIIFVVPINALVNPLLYTFTTPKYMTAVTSKNIFKMTYRYSSSGVEMSQSSHPISIYTKKYIKTNKKKALKEKRKDKNSTQENSLESTNGE